MAIIRVIFRFSGCVSLWRLSPKNDLKRFSGKRFRRFRFRVRFLQKRFRRFGFPVPVRFLGHPDCFGIVQKVFSEKASAIARMRQKCVKNASSFIGKKGTSKMRQKSVKIASKMRQKCAEHLGGEHLLYDTDCLPLACPLQ